MTPDRTPHLSRRHLLQICGGAVFASTIPMAARVAGSRDPRFITIVLRGALDGLTAAPPTGDPDFTAIRGNLTARIGAPRQLTNDFSLHPAMPNLARQFHANQALIIHAAASPYRDRSHFDGQDVLESGQPGPGHKDSGWLNRLTLIQSGKEKVSGYKGLAVGAMPPLIMRGPAECLAWVPGIDTGSDEDLPARLMVLYKETDPALAATFVASLKSRTLVGEATRPGPQSHSGAMSGVGMGMARLMARHDGPRIAALAIDGWDTHSDEVSVLNSKLAALDILLATLETTLGPVWNDTAILVITEFGRTAVVNGTNGTDHGTGTVAFLAGGAVKGGRVIADWPGLKTAQLYQARDLAPTTDIRAVAKGVMQGLFDTPVSAMNQDIFPDSAGVAPMRDLIA